MKKVNIQIVSNQEQGAEIVFEIMKEELANNRLQVIGLATGSTMIPVYEKWTQSSLDFSGVTTFNLDEYVGLEPTNHQSYAYFMDQHLFNHKDFKKVYRLDGMAQDLHAECEQFEQLLNEHPLDIQLLGVGENGHIAFNEPGTPFESVTHIAQLTPSTIEVNSRFFEEGEVIPETALTMGIQSITNAKKLILLAFGEKKRAALEILAEGQVRKDWPITKLLQHDDFIVITDLEIKA